MCIPSRPQPSHQAAGHVVAHRRRRPACALQAADQFAERVQIGQRLAGMGVIGQPVDHRASAVLGQSANGLMAVGADHDAVDVLAEHAGEIGHAFAGAEADVVAQEQAAAAEVGHAGLETDARAQRRLLEQHADHAARQQRLAQSLAESSPSDPP